MQGVELILQRPGDGLTVNLLNHIPGLQPCLCRRTTAIHLCDGRWSALRLTKGAADTETGIGNRKRGFLHTQANGFEIRVIRDRCGATYVIGEELFERATTNRFGRLLDPRGIREELAFPR